MQKHTKWSLLVSVLFFVLSPCFCLEAPNCTVKQDSPCTGITASGSSVAEMLTILHDHLCGCVYVEGNIHIPVVTSFPDFNEPLTESNFSFFYHIKEISEYLYLQNIPSMEQLSFPNLRIIRGESPLYLDKFALASFNCRITTLYMPQLTEITRGNIFFRGGTMFPSICNVRAVNWTDILSMNSSTLTINLPGCTDANKPDCSSLGCSNCWCNDSTAKDCCQIITSQCNGVCDGGRCNRRQSGSFVSITCCNDRCAAGCTGGSPSNCRACQRSSVLNGDTCIESCPRRRIFDVTVGDFVENPDFKFKLDGLCVKPCPSGTFELDDTLCVDQCPTGTMSVPSETGGEKCKDCDGICEKECVGGNTRSNDFTNCTTILGSLRIAQPLPEEDPADMLSAISTIRNITGSLSIELYNHPTFPYLSNLETIGSDFSEVLLFPCDNGTRLPYSIYITETDLISIDLSSLRDIHGGGVSVNNNPKLCFVGDFSQYLRNSSADLCRGSQHRRPMEECIANNSICHPQCNSSSGCWGPNDTQCVVCTNFEYEGRCVQECENFADLGKHLYSDITDKTCKRCHPFCSGNCSGEGASKCDSCLTDLFVLEDNGGFRCLNNSCIVGTYKSNVSKDGKSECLKCSSNCTVGGGCAGPLGVVDPAQGCFSCDTVLLDQNNTQKYCTHDSTCPGGYYRDSLNEISNVSLICSPCNDVCLRCSEEASKCSSCRYVRDGQDCLFECPVGKYANNDSICVSRESSQSAASLIIGTTVPITIILVVVAVVVVFVILIAIRSQRSKVIDSRYMFGGPNDLEMLTLEKETLQPPKVPPNAARLIVTPEDTLQFGKELGAGAFGTVYEGYWKPENDPNEYHVAIKVLKNTSPQANKELLQEGVVMGSMDHENVVRLYCVCMSQQLMLVSQFVPLGALLDYLKKYKDYLSATGILQFSSQIAQGMAYLESMHLVHRDLAARNVLVQSHRKVKITDFGLTRILESDQEHYKAESAKMPVRWLPPESIRHRVFTHKTDVWSFGVTVWEILTFGARPYQGKKPYQILKQLEGGQRLEQPVTCTIDLYAVLLECWLLEPESRPDFEDLYLRLDEMVKDPCRYVLTVKDGNASDYGQLPSNERQEGETVYEQPFVGDTSLPGTLPSNDSSINPYTEKGANGYYEMSQGKDKVAKDVPLGKKPTQEYLVPMSSPKSEETPRYVKINVGQPIPFPEPPPTNKHNYDYIDETRLKQSDLDKQASLSPAKNKEPDPQYSGYELPEDGMTGDDPLYHYETQQKSASQIEDFYDVDMPQKKNSSQIEDFYDVDMPQKKNSSQIEDFYDVEQSYEQPMDGQTTSDSGICNLMYDSRAGVSKQNVPPTNDYEEPEDPEDIMKGKKLGGESFVNPVYDSNPVSTPATHNYETVDDEDPVGGVTNLVYDSNTGTLPVTSQGLLNATYDSSAGVKSNAAAVNGFINATYDSSIGLSKGDNVPPANNYETVDDDEPVGGVSNLVYDSSAGSVPTAPQGFHNATYNSSIGLSKGNNVPPANNYETVDDDEPVGGVSNLVYDSSAGSVPTAPQGVHNATYDSTAGVVSKRAHIDSVINATYDSNVGVSNGGNVPPTNDYETVDDDEESLFKGNGTVVENYEVIDEEDIPAVKSGFINPTFDSGAGVPMANGSLILPNDNYEVIEDEEDVPIEGFVNKMYDSQAGVLTKSPDGAKPYSPEKERIASPYEIPVITDDYELPNEGHPDINVYDAPQN